MDALERKLAELGAADSYVDEKRREEIADYCTAVFFNLPLAPLPTGEYELFDGRRLSVEFLEDWRNKTFRLPTKAELVSSVETMLLLSEAFTHA